MNPERTDSSLPEALAPSALGQDQTHGIGHPVRGLALAQAWSEALELYDLQPSE